MKIKLEVTAVQMGLRQTSRQITNTHLNRGCCMNTLLEFRPDCRASAFQRIPQKILHLDTIRLGHLQEVYLITEIAQQSQEFEKLFACMIAEPAYIERAVFGSAAVEPYIVRNLSVRAITISQAETISGPFNIRIGYHSRGEIAGAVSTATFE
ncbi:MAG: hypothetical protein JWN14_3181, partial [Chthonomonadales bacterium]|nr:hypothetical protein [Chthonomonadales bacterium]